MIIVIMPTYKRRTVAASIARHHYDGCNKPLLISDVVLERASIKQYNYNMKKIITVLKDKLQIYKVKVKKLKKEVHVLLLASKDPRVPWYAKLFGLFVVGYALSPIDLIPDFIPVLGYVDDLILVPIGIALTIKMIPQEVLDDCRKQANGKIFEEEKTHWIAGALIILVWLAVAIWLVSLFFGRFR
ncbi:MAG: YkvA family protein [Thermoleophilia bacterium]